MNLQLAIQTLNVDYLVQETPTGLLVTSLRGRQLMTLPVTDDQVDDTAIAYLISEARS